MLKLKKITVNSKDYSLKPIDFNAMCELEDLGLSISDIGKARMSAIRALFAYHADLTSEEAGQEIMEHLKNGGNQDFFEPLVNSLVESDFFQATRQPSEAEKTLSSKDKA